MFPNLSSPISRLLSQLFQRSINAHLLLILVCFCLNSVFILKIVLSKKQYGTRTNCHVLLYFEPISTHCQNIAFLPSLKKSTAAAANVPCPHRSTSFVGVNQRSLKLSAENGGKQHVNSRRLSNKINYTEYMFYLVSYVVTYILNLCTGE